MKFIKSDDLIKSLLLKEQEKDSELEQTSEENEDFKKIVKKEVNEGNEEKSEIELNDSKQKRKLAWEGSFSRSWTLANSNILGKTVTLKYEISLSDGELSNTLSIGCGCVTLYFGNEGITKDKTKPEESIGDKELFKIPFPGTPIPVSFSFKLGGAIGYDVYFDSYAKEFTVSYTGELYAKAELGAGVSGFAEINVGAKGTLISLTAESTLTKQGEYYSSSNILYVSGGTITCYVVGKILKRVVFEISKDFLRGWSKRLY